MLNGRLDRISVSYDQIIAITLIWLASVSIIWKYKPTNTTRKQHINIQPVNWIQCGYLDVPENEDYSDIWSA